MKKRSTLCVLIVLSWICIGGCGLRKPSPADLANPTNFGPYPDNYEDLVKSHIDQTFYDPYSVRDLTISPPERAWYNFIGTLNYGGTEAGFH